VRYRQLLLDHGHLVPLKPGEERQPLPCGWKGQRASGDAASEPSGAEKAMTVRLPLELAAALEIVAAVDGKSMAQVIRTAIDSYLNARKQDSAFQGRGVAYARRPGGVADDGSDGESGND
jgi:predicted transcriptional regulator